MMDNCTNVMINYTRFGGIHGDYVLNITSSQDISINNSFIPDGDYTRGLYIDRSSKIEIIGTGIKTNGPGHIITSADNITLDMVELFAYTDQGMGIEIVESVDVTITRNMMYLYGYRSVGYWIERTQNLVISDCDITMNSGNYTGISLVSTTRTLIHKNRLQQMFSNTIGFEMSGDCEDTLISDNHIDLWGDYSNGVNILGSSAFTFQENGIDVWSKYSTGARLSGTIFDITNNTIGVYDDYSSGYIIEAEKTIIFGDEIHLNGDNTNGIMAISDEILINSTNINPAGAMSHGVILTGDTGKTSIRNSTFRITGADANGIISDAPSTRIEMIDLNITSSSNSDAIFVRDAKLMIHYSGIMAAGPAVTLMNCNDSTIYGSSIIGMPSVFAMDSDISVLSSNLSSDQFSIQAFDNSVVECLDSIIVNAESTSGSMIIVKNTIGIQLLDINGAPYNDVDVQVADGDTAIYSSVYFGGTDASTDANGMIPPMSCVFGIYYDGSLIMRNVTLLRVHVEGNRGIWNETYELDTSEPMLHIFSSVDIDSPAPPTGLTVVPQETFEKLYLQWDTNTDDTTRYYIYSFSLNDQIWKFEAVIEHPQSSWTSQELGPGVDMIYRITAWDSLYESDPSNWVSNRTLDLTAPGVPTEFHVISTTLNSIEVGWNVEDPSDFAGFRIEINDTSGPGFTTVATVGGDVRSLNITGLSWGTEYSLRIIGFDPSDNFSPYSTVLVHSTEMIDFSVTLNVSYTLTGPTPGGSAVNATVHLLAFNGTILMTGRTDDAGRYTFSGIDIDTYMLEVIPMDEGEVGLRSGYLSNTSSPFDLNETVFNIIIDMKLDYYEMPSQGYINTHITYSGGPLEGLDASGAIVQLMDENGILLEENEAGSMGRSHFIIEELPIRGRFRVEPPAYITAEEGVRSGYTPVITNYFYLDHEEPDFGTMEIVLEYYTYIPPPAPLMILQTEPTGTITNLSTSIVIQFDQPVDTSTVEMAFTSDPPLKDISFIWDTANTTLTIRHGGLIPDTTYRIEITGTAVSAEGTSFPENYTANSWEFTTAPEIQPEEENGGGISRETIIIIIIVGIVIFIIVLFIILGRTGNKEEDLDGEYPEDDYYENDFDEMGDYPEGEYSDEEYTEDEYSDEEYPDEDDTDEEYLEDEYDEEEFPEDEEFDEEPIPEDELYQDDLVMVDDLLDEDYMDEEMDEDLPPEEQLTDETTTEIDTRESVDLKDKISDEVEIKGKEKIHDEPFQEKIKPRSKKRAKKKIKKKMNKR